MKTAIVYGSKTGTTKKCADLLAEKLTEVTVFDLTKETPDISGYDTVIVGGSIRMGMLHKAAKKFIVQNTELLKTKRTGYFICCGSPGDIGTIMKPNIAMELLEAAVCFDSFGGEIDIDKQKGLDKIIIKMVTKGKDKSVPQILHVNIQEFAKKILS